MTAVLVKNYGLYSELTKYDRVSTLKKLYIYYSVNRKIEAAEDKNYHL